VKSDTSTQTVQAQGIMVTDRGDYFRVEYAGGGGGASTFPKSYNGFQTSRELLAWLLRR
jgi:hypothetical protein